MSRSLVAAGETPAPRVIAAVIAALALAACPARLVPVGSRSQPMLPAAEVDSPAARADGPAAVASVQPADEDGMALLVVTVRWPERERGVASLHPATERISLELTGPGPLPSLPDLTRPGGGSLVKSTSVKLLVVDGIAIRATAFAGTGDVVGMSLPTPVNLRRNARVDVPVEILPASGTSQLTATLLTPTIAGVSPDRGYPQQTTIAIRGTNFGFGQGFGSVKFGGQDAGQAATWTDSALGGATISVQVPPGARTGPIQVRVGSPLSTQSATWPAQGSGGGDPWAGHFTVLGPVGDPMGLDTGMLGDHQLAWDGNRFWAFWTKAAGGAMQLLASPLVPDSSNTVSSLTKGGTITVATAQGIQLGGSMTDPTGAWISWQETGAVKMAHVVPGAAGPDNVVTLTNSPAVFAQPVLARATDGRLIAAWIDNRDTPQGGPTKNRLYARGFMPSGEAIGQPIPIQQSNGPTDTAYSTITHVGTPSIAVGKTSYLVSWQETYSTSWSIWFQPLAFSGNRLYFEQASGWHEAGPGQSEFMNTYLPASSGRSLEDGRLLYNGKDDGFVVVYASRWGGSTGSSSDIYLHHRDYTGKEVGLPVQIADDTRRQGRVNCPSFDPGTPCGQGSRHDPQVTWNGRDYMLAWQMDRDDGEVDIIGARLQRDSQADFLRAPEEATSPQPGEGYPRSVAEIVYSFEPGRTGVSLPGAQTLPRLAWGADVMLVGWIEPKGDQSAVVVRLWR